MPVRTAHRSTTSSTLAALARPGAAIGIFWLVPTLVGCQTIAPWAGAEKTQAAEATATPSGPMSAKTDDAVTQTGFRSEVTADQQYNVHLEIGRVYEAQQQYDAALAEYEKALEAATRRGFGTGVKGSGAKQSFAHRRMGGALDRLGRFSQAEAHYRTALKLSPDDPKVWNDAGYSYYMQSRWVDAERSLKTAAKLAPDDVKIQTNLGLALAAQGKTDEALVALSKAGGQAVGHANLGYLMAANGQTSQARAHYQTALQLQPNLAPARQALAALESQGIQAQAAQIASATPPPTRNSDVNLTRVATTPRATATPGMPATSRVTATPSGMATPPRVMPAPSATTAPRATPTTSGMATPPRATPAPALGTASRAMSASTLTITPSPTTPPSTAARPVVRPSARPTTPSVTPGTALPLTAPR